MREAILQIARRSLIAGGVAGGLGLIGILVLRLGLRAMGWEPAPMIIAVEFGLILAAIGFALCFIFELATAGLRRVRGTKPKDTVAAEVSLPESGDGL